jgi:hypothetical protein
LDVTRIESQSLSLKEEQFNLNDVITNVINDILTSATLDFSACKQSTILFFLHMYSVSIQKQNDKAKLSHYIVKHENGTPP